jgi:hypothetical protein
MMEKLAALAIAGLFLISTVLPARTGHSLIALGQKDTR